MAAHWNKPNYIIQEYNAPGWASQLPYVPQNKLELAQLPTPVHRWNISGLPEGFQLHIKRDDLSGSTLSGNKVRKLEFTMAEALRTGCKHVITAGYISSNHCRCTAAAAAQIGLKCHLFLRTDIKVTSEVGCQGNMFFNRMFGADMYLIPSHYNNVLDVLPRQKQLSERIQKETGELSYVLPVGGSDTAGMFGYVEAFRELIEQGMLDHVSDIAFASGSGGTAAGLAVANYLTTGSRIGIHAFLIAYNSQVLHDHCNAEFKKLGLPIQSQDAIDCIDEYFGSGYRKVQQQDLDFIQRVALESGIVLDPTYTGKAARGLYEEIQKNPQRFKGNKILFIHTGGVFGAMDHEGLVSKLTHASSNLHIWVDENHS